MYSEIIKIIEGGLAGDKEKVTNYARLFASNLEKEGNLSLSKKIESLLLSKKEKFITLDSLSSKPVDIESRMDIVNISFPKINQNEIVLNDFIFEEIFDFIRTYSFREELILANLEIPNTLLLYGPPGCGKTTVAQFIASKTGLPLITAQLDSMISSLLGSTAKNIRRIFDYASRRECILLLDEFDVVAKLRDDKHELGELKRVVNSLIQNIDSFNSQSILISATNHHELLDPAIWRRFSKIIKLDKPTKKEIMNLLGIYLNTVNNNFSNSKVLMETISDSLADFSHSEIKTTINNSIKKMIIENKNEVSYLLVLQEIYFQKNHRIHDNRDFVKFLLSNRATQKDIFLEYKFPIRFISEVNKELAHGRS